MSQIEELEALKLTNLRQITLRDQILKLTDNFEFRKVILEEFFEKEAARLIRAAGDPNLDQKQRDDCLQMAMATGHVQRFLSANIQMGNRAEENNFQADEALAELRAEGSE